MQIDCRTESLTQRLPSRPESLETISILPPPLNEETGQRDPHFAPPITPDPIIDDRLPINIFVQGTSSRGVKICMFPASVFSSTVTDSALAIHPKDQLGDIMQVLRRRHLIADLTRIEHILVAGKHILDLNTSVNDAGLSNDCIVEVRVRVRGGSMRLVSERM